ncbi:MAG: SCO family protein [Acidobacteriota bacterium]|nr:SCO family protein [Acidobacteriota bacterium]
MNKSKLGYLPAAGLLLFCLCGIPLILAATHGFFNRSDYYGLKGRGAMPEVRLITTADKIYQPDRTTDSFTYLFFGFTNCSTVCPSAFGDLSVLAARAPEDVRFLFVTIDPERDDAAALAQFEKAYGGRLTALRGTWDQVTRLAGAMKTRVSKPARKGADSGFNHEGTIYLLDPSGAVVLAYPENHRDIEQMMTDLHMLRRDENG